MNICEYCGRTHFVKQPDLRFCSFLCRSQYDHYSATLLASTEKEITAVDYKRTHAAWMAEQIVSITEDARRVLAAMPMLASDPQLDLVHRLLLSLAEDVPTAKAIYAYTSLTDVESTPLPQELAS